MSVQVQSTTPSSTGSTLFRNPTPRFPPNQFSSDQSHYRHQFHRGGGRQPFRHHHYQQQYRPFPRPSIIQPSPGIGTGGQTAATTDSNSNPNEYDGRRLRKSLVRKTVDYNAAIIKGIQNRVWQRDHRDRRSLEPDYSYAPDTVPPSMLLDNSSNAVTTRYVKSATNKMRCPIFSMAWTPEGRRLVTGASSGEFTLWNGLTFNFETILQAHDSPVRSMIWSHNDVWMVTGDHAGYVKYWQSNMNNVKMFQAHKEAVRGLTFSPSDQKFASCSDDGTVRVWDFYTCYEEKILRGHGADVKCVDWHPHKGIIVSGSKDNQQPIKIWDPKIGTPLATLHAHKSTVMDARWNRNGNWLITASRDHLVKIFDIRKLSQEFQVFRGHKKEASCLSWHPVHENLFASGGSDGSILFWNVGCEKEVGSIENAHDNIIWTLAWHPVGHILCSGSNDHTSKFWTRQKPGDIIRDKHPGAFHDYSAIDDNEMEEAFIPGMGPEDKIDMTEDEKEEVELVIPGLDITEAEHSTKMEKQSVKKIPYQKPIPRKFQAIWNDSKVDDELEDDHRGERIYFGDRDRVEAQPPRPMVLLPPQRMRRRPTDDNVQQIRQDPFNPNVGFGPMGAQYNEYDEAGGGDDEYLDEQPFWPPPPPPPHARKMMPPDRIRHGPPPLRGLPMRGMPMRRRPPGMHMLRPPRGGGGWNNR